LNKIKLKNIMEGCTKQTPTNIRKKIPQPYLKAFEKKHKWRVLLKVFEKKHKWGVLVKLKFTKFFFQIIKNCEPLNLIFSILVIKIYVN